MIFIYALIHPLDKSIRYIGKTNNIKQRYYQHLRDSSKSYKSSWIKSLLPLIPEIIILDEITSDDWEFWEIHWINQCKCWGYNLTNLTNGGKGHSGYKQSDEQKLIKSLKNKNRIVSDNTRKKLSESRIGIVFTNKHIENLSKSHIGLKYDNSNYGKHTKTKICQYDENNNLIKIWNSIKEASEFYNVNYTSISHCCAGRKKRIKGFVWKYHTELN